MWNASELSPVPASATTVAVALEQGESRGLADRDAVAVGRERPARALRQQLQRAKALQRRQREAVHTRDDRRVALPGGDRALRHREHLRARRARGRHRRPYARDAERLGQEARRRGHAMDVAVMTVAERPALFRGLRAHGQLGVEDARGARADEDADARGAVGLRARGRRLVRSRPDASASHASRWLRQS
jgi:hypothetical protein